MNEVPTDLSDHHVVLFSTMDRAAVAVDLGTGTATRLDTPAGPAPSDGLLRPLGDRVLVFGSDGRARLVDWSFDDSRWLPVDADWISAVAVGDWIWHVGAGDQTAVEAAGVRRINADESVHGGLVRTLLGGPQIVGTHEGGALITPRSIDTIYQLAPDGTATPIIDGHALVGGTSWVVVSRCSPSYVCTAELIDLADDAEAPLGLIDAGFTLLTDPNGRSDDGRRALINGPKPASATGDRGWYLLDADELNLNPIAADADAFAFDDFDPQLRYGLRLVEDHMTITELLSGHAVTIPTQAAYEEVLGGRPAHLLLAPSDWTPP
ncbi:MAG: hypothetical protein AAGD18_17505 [Actinomycetota bacterium]